MGEDIRSRLEKLFGTTSMAEIARRISVPHATVRNYFRGRLPASEVLLKIADETNVSINWLLTGKGEMYAGTPAALDLDRLLELKIERMLERKLGGHAPQEEVQDLGTLDAKPAFDVEGAVKRWNDPQHAMRAWFAHEGRDYPEDFGVVFFQGWESFSEAEKIEALKDAKKVLDRALRAR